MKKIISSLFIVLLLGGCANEYHDNMQARKEIAWTQATNQRLAVSDIMNITNKLIEPFEVEKYKELQSQVIQIKPSKDDYALVLLSNLFQRMLDHQARMEIARARAEVFRYLVPIIQSIYEQNMANFGTPMSTNEVLAQLVGQIPFVATVGGMYALGYQGIKNAGDQVNATLSDNAMLNHKGGNMAGSDIVAATDSEYSSTRTTTTTTTTDSYKDTATK